MATVRRLSAAHGNTSLGSELIEANVKLDSVNKKLDRLLLGQERLQRQLERVPQDPGSLEGEAGVPRSGESGPRAEGSCPCSSLHQDISQMLLTLCRNYQQHDRRMASLENALVRVTERLAGSWCQSESSGGLSDLQIMERTERTPEPATQRVSEGDDGSKAWVETRDQQATAEPRDGTAAKELSNNRDTLTEKETLQPTPASGQAM
uniref:uncharacterized protein n=1 Tax=Pristiophorus japonicus TaxID=55135 RepID=UPI00398EB72D